MKMKKPQSRALWGSSGVAWSGIISSSGDVKSDGDPCRLGRRRVSGRRLAVTNTRVRFASGRFLAS